MRELLRAFELRVAAVRLPSRRICIAVVVICLGFGALIGRVTRPQPVRDAAQTIELQEPVASAQASAPPITEPAQTPAGEEHGESESESSSGGSAEAPGKGAKQASTNRHGEEAGNGSRARQTSQPAGLPPVKHVFLIVLDDAAYAEVFGPESKSHYLAHTLESKGELLVRYDAVAHQQLADGVALISGQGPTEQTVSDCPTYTAILPGSDAAAGQVTGNGCVYPSSVQTIGSQLSAKHLSWRAYVQGIGNGAPEASSACQHPQLGAPDPTSAFGLPGASAPAAGILAATFRNPFVYFRSVIGSNACTSEDVGLGRLGGDLAGASATPNLSYIVPGLCDDGAAKPCGPGKPDGMSAAEGFLRQVVPKILSSRAYKRNGLLVITVDEAPSSGEYADSSSCCGQPRFPNIHLSASPDSGGGGGEVGALLLSPFIKGGQVSQEPYNHFSLLRTIEDIFGVGHLGYAGLSAVSALSPSLFSSRATPPRSG